MSETIPEHSNSQIEVAGAEDYVMNPENTTTTLDEGVRFPQEQTQEQPETVSANVDETIPAEYLDENGNYDPMLEYAQNQLIAGEDEQKAEAPESGPKQKTHRGGAGQGNRGAGSATAHGRKRAQNDPRQQPKGEPGDTGTENPEASTGSSAVAEFMKYPIIDKDQEQPASDQTAAESDSTDESVAKDNGSQESGDTQYSQEASGQQVPAQSTAEPEAQNNPPSEEAADQEATNAETNNQEAEREQNRKGFLNALREKGLTFVTGAQIRWQNLKQAHKETFFSESDPESARFNRRLAYTALGAAAIVATAYAAYRGFEAWEGMETDPDVSGGDSDTEGTPEPGESSEADTTPEEEPAAAEPEDISAEQGLPEGYLVNTADGYEATAMPGNETDSIWRAAEHALRDYLGHDPNTVEVNELQNRLGNHWLDVGDKVNISNELINEALQAAGTQ